MLYDKEFKTESEAIHYCDIINNEEGYYADCNYDIEYSVWVVEVWKI